MPNKIGNITSNRTRVQKKSNLPIKILHLRPI